MRRYLAVERLGQMNLFARSLDAELSLQQDVFGARVLRRWENGPAGSRHALVLIGRTGVETFAPVAPGGAVALRSDGNGPGWDSLQWQVSSLGDAVTALREHGVRVDDDADGRAVVRPEDMHGLPIGLTDRQVESNDRHLVDRKPDFWSEERGLGLVGGAAVKVVAVQPEKAAANLAGLVGREAYAIERRHLNMAGHGVRFDDHAVEFVGSATGSRTDLAGGYLAERGERIFCLTFTVRDLLAARSFLVGRNVRFAQYGRHSLFLARVDVGGARIEITDTD